MANDIIFELKRKSIHIFALLYVLIYFLAEKFFNKEIALLSLTAILIFFFVLEFFRIHLKKKIPLFQIFWREKESNKLGGHFYFAIGAIIVFAICDFNIAMTALFMTVFGDMAAALFGMKFGKHWIKAIPETAWEGIIAEFAVDIIIGFIFLQNFFIILAMALVATFVETVFVHLDDNMAIPISAGFVGQIILILS